MTNPLRWSAPSALLLALLVSSPARCAASEPRAHEGLFARISAGAGGTATSIEPNPGVPRFELSGTAYDVDVAIGAVVARNLALHGTIFGWSADDPTAEQSGFPSQDLRGSVTMAAYGAGATWYWMPVNAYVTGSVGLGSLRFDFPSASVGDKSDLGLALTAAIGKEWWIGGEWALGVSGGVIHHSSQDSTLPSDWSGTSYALRFSATFD